MSATQTQAEASIRLATEQELPYWAALSGLMRGWSLAHVAKHGCVRYVRQHEPLNDVFFTDGLKTPM